MILSRLELQALRVRLVSAIVPVWTRTLTYSLVSALKQARRGSADRRALRALDDERAASTPRAAKDLRTQVLAKVADWRTMLRQEASDARTVLSVEGYGDLYAA